MLEIKETQCDQCLFSKNRIVDAKRAGQIIAECKKEHQHFECHKGTIEGKRIVCRGFYDRYDSQMIQVAERLNLIKFVP